MNKLIAQAGEKIGAPLEGIGPLGLEGKNSAGAGTIFNNILSSAIGLITIIGAIWFVIVLFSGALGIMTAGGDKAKVESAQKRITSGLIGLVVLIAGVFLIDLIGKLLGFGDILNPGDFINKIGGMQ